MLQALLCVAGFFAVRALTGVLEYFLRTLKTLIPGLILPAAAALLIAAWMIRYTCREPDGRRHSHVCAVGTVSKRPQRTEKERGQVEK